MGTLGALSFCERKGEEFARAQIQDLYRCDVHGFGSTIARSNQERWREYRKRSPKLDVSGRIHPLCSWLVHLRPDTKILSLLSSAMGIHSCYGSPKLEESGGR